MSRVVAHSFLDLGGFLEVGSFGEATTELVSKTDTRASQWQHIDKRGLRLRASCSLAVDLYPYIQLISHSLATPSAKDQAVDEAKPHFPAFSPQQWLQELSLIAMFIYGQKAHRMKRVTHG
jgi:hypothetical protein